MHQDAHEFQNYLLNKMIDELDEERKLLAAAQSEDGAFCLDFQSPRFLMPI